jgi:hypothetical protein
MSLSCAPWALMTQRSAHRHRLGQWEYSSKNIVPPGRYERKRLFVVERLDVDAVDTCGEVSPMGTPPYRRCLICDRYNDMSTACLAGKIRRLGQL